MTDIKTALKPCPFCGKQPELCDYTSKPAASWVLSHKERGCIMRIVSQFQTKDAALETWNTRAAPVDAQDAVDSEDAAMLDFMISPGGFIVWSTRDDTIKQCQLWTQDEDEEIIYLSGVDKFFNTPRDAIRAAMAALQASQSPQDQETK